MREIDASALLKPASQEEIIEAENSLGVRFPDSYKWFLEEFGAAEFPFEICGIPHPTKIGDAHSTLDVVDVTKSERRDLEPNLPKQYVVLSADGMGNHWCLDTSQLKNGECPVIFWNHEAGENQLPQRTDDTFLNWIEGQISNEEMNQIGRTL